MTTALLDRLTQQRAMASISPNRPSIRSSSRRQSPASGPRSPAPCKATEHRMTWPGCAASARKNRCPFRTQCRASAGRISVPITAIAALIVWDMACSLSLMSLPSYAGGGMSTAGPFHYRTFRRESRSWRSSPWDASSYALAIRLNVDSRRTYCATGGVRERLRRASEPTKSGPAAAARCR